MSASRRTFLQQALMTSGLLGLLESGASGPALAERLMAAAGQAKGGAGIGPPVGQHDSQSFWDSFGTAAADGPAAPEGVHGRGLFKKPAADPAAAAGPGGGADRLVDYYQYYTDPKTKQTTLRLATSIDANELLDHEGDISANVNVNGFHMAGEDQQTFNQLQSAQLRLDMVQTQSLMPEYLDTMAWMSMAGLFPDKTGKLPPLEDLTFNPSTTSQGSAAKTSQMVLPGGAGQMAVNLSMTHKESTLYLIIKNMTDEVGRFSPLIGLPAISVTALKGFCSLYGAMEQRTTFLMKSMPKAAYATQAAREAAQTSSGLNLVPGDYILVPNAHSAELTPYLDKLDLRQGYLVPKGAPSTTSVYDLAAALKPDITYLSASIGLKPVTTPSSPGKAAAKSSSSSSSSGSQAASDGGSEAASGGSSAAAKGKSSSSSGSKSSSSSSASKSSTSTASTAAKSAAAATTAPAATVTPATAAPATAASEAQPASTPSNTTAEPPERGRPVIKGSDPN